MKSPLLCIALFTALVPSAHAIYKCDANGSVVFQDAPCAGGKGGEIRVSPASGRSSQPSAEPLTPAVGTDARASAENATVAALKRTERARRLREIDEEVAAAQSRIAGARQVLDSEMARLQLEQTYANNNLAGATYQQAKSTEMQAASDRFRGVMEYEQANIRALQDEKKALGGR